MNTVSLTELVTMAIRERSMTSLARSTGDIFCKVSDNVTDIEEMATYLLECRHYQPFFWGGGPILQFAINADISF